MHILRRNGRIRHCFTRRIKKITDFIPRITVRYVTAMNDTVVGKKKYVRCRSFMMTIAVILYLSTVNERKKVNFPVCFEMERVIRNIGEHKSNNIWKQRSVNSCFFEELQLSSHISMKLTNASFRKFCHWTSDTDRECTVMTEVSVFRVLLLSNNLTLGSFHPDRPGAYQYRAASNYSLPTTG